MEYICLLLATFVFHQKSSSLDGFLFLWSCSRNQVKISNNIARVEFRIKYIHTYFKKEEYLILENSDYFFNFIVLPREILAIDLH